MRKLLAILILVGLFSPLSLFAGEKEDFQVQLRIAILESENAGLKSQIAQKALGDILKTIQDKGYVITQGQDGQFLVNEKPKETPKPPEKK